MVLCKNMTRIFQTSTFLILIGIALPVFAVSVLAQDNRELQGEKKINVKLKGDALTPLTRHRIER
jgi:hypothetical protein